MPSTASTTMVNYLTLVTVGDRNSRKTELLLKYTGNYKSKHHYEFVVPRFQDNIQNIIVDRVPYAVYFMDIECDDDYEILRRGAYEKANCILLCYSVIIKETYKSVYKKWVLEIRKYAPFTPIVLIGTDIEERHKNNKGSISTERGEYLKRLIGADAFIECSIEQLLGIDDIFIQAVRSSCYRLKRHQ